MVAVDMKACEGLCGFVVTGVTRSHCCRACSRTSGVHGPACKKVPVGGASQEGQPPENRLGEACAGQCGFVVTGVTPTHCCMACANKRDTHGPACQQQSLEFEKVVLQNLTGQAFGPYELRGHKDGITLKACVAVGDKGMLQVNEKGEVGLRGKGGKRAVFKRQPLDGLGESLAGMGGYLSVSNGKLVMAEDVSSSATWTLRPENDTEGLNPLYAAITDASRNLTHAEKVKFMDEGYIQARGVIPTELIHDALRTINNALIQPGAVIRGDDGSTTITPDIKGHESIKALLYRSPLWSMCQDLVGGPGCLKPAQGAQIALRGPNPNLCEKDPSSEIKTGWHVDGVGKGKHSAFTILVGVTLSETSSVNQGNLVVWPRSHHFLLPLLKEDPSMSERPTLPMDPVHLLAQPGDVTIVHQKVAHSGGPNAGHNIRYQVYFRLSHTGHAENASAGLTLDSLWCGLDGLPPP